MIYVTENELEQLICEDARGIGKAKERMVGEYCPQPHCSCVQDPLMAKAAETAMTMDNLDTFSDKDVSEDGEERKDGWKCGLSVDDEKGHMIHFEPVGEIAHTLSIVMRVRDDNDLVASVYELARELVNVRFDASWLWKEEVADHGDVVAPASHGGGERRRGGETKGYEIALDADMFL